MTTQPNDTSATAYVAYFLPDGYKPPNVGGALPAELDFHCYAKVQAQRTR